MKKKLLLLTIIFYQTFLFGQHGDCVNAISVCQNSYTMVAPQGTGNQPNELPQNTCLSGENNSTWFVITPRNTGMLSFVITPSNPNDDYNWEIYDITNATCGDIATNPNVQLVCNNSSDLTGSFGDAVGKTGAFSNQPWYGGIFSFYPSFQSDITVQEGEVYMLYVKNTSTVGQGFTIDFSTSSSMLFSTTPASLDSIAVPSCGATTMDIYFSNPILCNSVSTSDFTIQTSLGTISPLSVTSPNCNPGTTGATSTMFTLTFPISLIPDSYTFNIVNSVSDACGGVVSQTSLPFNVPSLPVNAGNDIIVCDGQILNQNIGMAGIFPGQTFQWTAQPSSYLSNLSNTSSSIVNLNIGQMPVDTVMFILSTSTGNGCVSKDTMYVFGTDCCSNFDASITNFTDVACHGTSTGIANVTVSGSLAPTYTYLWNSTPQQFTSQATTLAANQQYIVTVTDGNQCEDTATIMLTEPLAPLVTSSTGTNVNCFGGNNGTIDVTVSGGTLPYSYNWNNTETTEDLINLAAGIYIVTVVDDNNCTITEQRVINQPATPLTASSSGSIIFCNQTTGSVSLNITGGGSPYTLNWNNNLGNTTTLSNLIAGTYTATITDNNGCVITKDATVNSTANITTTITATPATCNLIANGSINLTVSGGQSPYTFAWDNGAGTVQNPSNLLPGMYNVTITDANGCLSTTNATITSNSSVVATANSTDISCFNANDGSINLNITGGQTPYSINWNNGLGAIQNQTNLASNVYAVTVTDALGCTDTAVAVLNQPGDIIINQNVTNVACNGGNNGSIQLFLSGGTPPFTANWQGLSGNTLVQNNLTAGNYAVTVTDANGCQKLKTISISEPPALLVALTPNTIPCNGGNSGSIQNSVSGGVTPYTFLWSNNATTQDLTNVVGGTYTVTVTGADGCFTIDTTTIVEPAMLGGTIIATNVTCFGGNDGTITTTPVGGTTPYTFLWSNNATTQNLTNATAGNYLVQVTDVNGCQIVLPISITEPPSITISTSVTAPTCHGNTNGSIQATASTGVAPYTYTWSGGLIGQNPQNVAAGTYSLTVTDANSCMATTTVNVVAPAVISASFNNTDATCSNTNDGTIGTVVSGGTAPFTFSWSGGLTGQNPQNVMPGTYNVTITDANNCSTTATTTVNAPAAIIVSTVDNPPACGQNGTITANIANGNAPFNYTWSANANTGNSNIASSLSGGNYIVTVTDALGCVAVSNTVTFASSSNLAVSTTVLHPQCQPTTGVIGITPISGVAPFNYTWSSNANVGNVNTANGLSGGNYTITVTDAFNCDTTLIVNLNSTTILAGSATVNDATCSEDNGSITYNATGGTSPYVYAWSSTPNNVNTIDDLAPGDYDLVLTDANNCSVLETITVSGSDSLMIADSVIQIGCDSDGGIYLNVSGGNAPYDYIWSTNASTGNIPNATNLAAGNYTVTIRDIDNCSTTRNYNVNEVTPFSIDIVEQIDNDCPNGTDGRATVNAINTTNTVTYLWSNGNTGPTATNLPAGDYTVTVTDVVTNCQMTETFLITEPSAFTIDINNDLVVEAGTTITLQVMNPMVGVQYTWTGSNGFTGNGTSLTTIVNDEVIFTVTGTYGTCTPVTNSFVVKASEFAEIEIPNAFSPNNDGKNDVFRIATFLNLEILEFKVFNRYGELLYNDIQGEWDGTYKGKEMANGGYIYLIRYKAPNGDEVPKKGEVILIR